MVVASASHRIQFCVQFVNGLEIVTIYILLKYVLTIICRAHLEKMVSGLTCNYVTGVGDWFKVFKVVRGPSSSVCERRIDGGARDFFARFVHRPAFMAWLGWNCRGRKCSFCNKITTISVILSHFPFDPKCSFEPMASMQTNRGHQSPLKCI